ncbi:shikimate dehydrogenase [Amycolatopsis sp. NPDC005961]|uniref:shikimate dehydrogenase n=1 Tax=Amycolatopsis sp. NPDC005961 TaxID=3156720 RepID=UPI00340ADE4C
MSSAVDAIRAHAARATPGTVLTGLIGAGIGPSLSPPLHETEARRLGMDLVYARFDLDELDVPATAVGPLLTAAREAGYSGLNITHPCKQVVVEHLDELSPDAAALAAVNTVVFERGRAVGHNTDWSGFARGLRTGLPEVALGSVVLLGAGGAGAAVAHGLLTAGAGRVQVFDLDASRATELAAALADRFGAGRASAGAGLGTVVGGRSGVGRASAGSDPEAAVGDRFRAGRASAGADLEAALSAADGLVHATPTGMAAHPGLPVPAGLLRPDLWIAEVVYRPLETELVRAARAVGARVLDGGRMAVFQAAEAFALFTGAEPDAARMARHFATLTETTPAERQPADVLD